MSFSFSKEFDKKYNNPKLDKKTIDKNLKREEAERYSHFIEYMEVLGLHVEPALRGVNPLPYNCSDVLHTSIIDVDSVDYPAEYLDSQRADSVRARKEARNHQGYKKAFQLMRGERFGFKECAFIHAFAPTSEPRGRKTKLYFTKQIVKDKMQNTTDLNEFTKLENELEDLKYIKATGCFNKFDFLHYRYWFMDCDWNVYYTPEEIELIFEYLGLKDYLLLIVRTSPTKYHIYLKSEMVCSEEQVSRWAKPLSEEALSRLADPEYIENIKEVFPKKTGKAWAEVARRGIPSIDRLANLNHPIPEDAVLVDGNYVGDNEVYGRFVTMCKKFSEFFGSDPKVYNATRVAQIPGYTNPKSKFPVEIVYQNKQAKVLTVSKAEKSLVRMNKYYSDNGKWFYDAEKDTESRKDIEPDPPGIFLAEYEEQKSKLKLVEKKVEKTEKVEKVEKKPKKTKETETPPETLAMVLPLRPLPDSPEEYAKRHKVKELIWDEKIYGKSNDMLLALSRFAVNYINIKDVKQVDLYFNGIIRPYFSVRKCDATDSDPDLVNIRKRFATMLDNETNNKIYSEPVDNLKIKQIATRLIDSIYDHYDEKNVSRKKIEKEIRHSQVFFEALSKEFLIYNQVPYLRDSSIYYEAGIQCGKLKGISNYNKKKNWLLELGILEQVGHYRIGVICKRYRLVLPKLDSDVWQVAKNEAQVIPFKRPERIKITKPVVEKPVEKPVVEKPVEKPIPAVAEAINPEYPWDTLIKRLAEFDTGAANIQITTTAEQDEKNKKPVEKIDRYDTDYLEKQLAEFDTGTASRTTAPAQPTMIKIEKPSEETITQLKQEIVEITKERDQIKKEYDEAETAVDEKYKEYRKVAGPYYVIKRYFHMYVNITKAKRRRFPDHLDAIKAALASFEMGNKYNERCEHKIPVVLVYEKYLPLKYALSDIEYKLETKQKTLESYLSPRYGSNGEVGLTPIMEEFMRDYAKAKAGTF